MSDIRTSTHPRMPAKGGATGDRAAPREFAPIGAAPVVHSASAVPLILRVTLGGVMLPHGLQKVFGLFGGGGFAATIDGFQQNFAVPPYLTVAVMAAEFLGALGLLFGLLTRLSALGIAAVMLGAISLQHWPNGFFMDWQNTGDGQGFEFHLLAIGIAIALVIGGAGPISLDHLRRRRR